MNPLSELQPKSVWEYFYQISQVPRPSKKEEKIRKFLIEFGKTHKLETLSDSIGNVVIKKPATKGFESLKSVVLQSHMDMVCEKNSDVEFDFEKDAIQTRIEGEWVKAKGTTLGGDDGIGIAASLAILSAKDIDHGPIECLFTVDEETGLTGAFNLDEQMIDSRILLNLDSEDEGELFIGCAGGRDTIASLDLVLQPKPESHIDYKIEVSGLTGGHSGDDIQKGFANANILLIRLLWQARRDFGIHLTHIDGGNLRNAIAREAYAQILVSESNEQDFLNLMSNLALNIKKEFYVTEPNMQFKIEISTQRTSIIKDTLFDKIIDSMFACPHGVIAWSQDIPNFVETSTNLASVKIKEDKIIITTSQRSSVESALDMICNKVNAVFSSVQAKIIHTDGYPGWTPNTKSEIMEITKDAYYHLFSKEPKVLAIHAGLECGLIGKKFPSMDMISFGPTVKGAHSPDERMKIDTVKMFYDLIIEVLKRIPKV